MTAQTVEQLRAKRCLPCEGGVPKLTPAEAEAQLAKLQGWAIVHQGERIRKEWVVKNFMAAMCFFEQVAEVSETEGHHPVIVTEWGKVTVTWWTHKIKGLHRNDFIMAAKTDRL